MARLPIRRSPFGRTPRGGRINDEIEQYDNKWTPDDLKQQVREPLTPQEDAELEAWRQRVLAEFEDDEAES